MADLASQITVLQADFQRIADRAAWVRAFFTVKGGRVGYFSFGRAGGDGRDEAILLGGLSPAYSELYALTDRAGALAAELLRSGRYEWNPTPEALQYKYRELWEYWLVFLLHTPPACFSCKWQDPDGGTTFGPAPVGGDVVAVWIDNYPQVCVSALAILKAGAQQRQTAGKSGRRGKGRPKDEERAKRDEEFAKQRRIQQQIIDRLIAEAGPKRKWKAALDRLSRMIPENRQFQEQVKEAGWKLDQSLIDKARRKVRAAAQTN